MMPGRIAVAACVLITLLGPSMAQSGGSAETAIRDALIVDKPNQAMAPAWCPTAKATAEERSGKSWNRPGQQSRRGSHGQ